MSPYTVIVRRSGNPFEICHVCVSWLIGAGYDAYVVVGCAQRDTCMGIRYRTTCPDVPDETEVNLIPILKRVRFNSQRSCSWLTLSYRQPKYIVSFRIDLLESCLVSVYAFKVVRRILERIPRLELDDATCCRCNVVIFKIMTKICQIYLS